MEKRREMSKSVAFDTMNSSFYNSIKDMNDNQKRTINNIPVTTGCNSA